FLGFEDAGGQRVGCLLHPSRWRQEVRPRTAFALLRGFGCGSPDYYCLAAHWFARSRWQDQDRFGRRAIGLDWYEFSQAASRYRPSGDSSPATSPRAQPGEAEPARLPAGTSLI